MNRGRKLAIDPQHDSVWEALEGLRSSAVVSEARAFASEEALRQQRRRRFWSNLFAFSPARLAAATACLAAFAGAGWWLTTPTIVEYATRIGEIRSETLADGTKVILDTDSRIRIAYTGKARDLELLQGQAHFDVTHDAARPFQVTFGRGTVTAIGTSFDVTAFANSKMVTLLGGRVVVEGAAGGGARAYLSPGQRVTLRPDGRLTPPSMVDSESVSSWQRGRIDLADLTLDEALAQVNRYSTTKIVVREPSLAQSRVSGIFRAGDVDAVTAALCAYFDLKVVRRTPEAIIIAKSG